LRPGERLASVRRQHVRYSPGKRCDVLCALSLDGDPAPRLATITFAALDWLSRARHEGAFLDEERSRLVELFPADFELPGLACATDPRQVAPFLASLADAWSTADARPLRVEVLRYVPHRRCVLRYEMDAPDGPRRLIGKVYADAGRAADVGRKLLALREQLPGVAPALAGVHEAWNLTLMELVAGESMKRMLRDGPSLECARDAVRRAAAALASLHAVRLEGAGAPSILDEVRHVAKRGARIGLVAPALGAQLDSLLARLDALARDLVWDEPTFIHDGFKPAQVLLDGDRVHIIDYDGSGRGDPAIDVGKFMAQLRKEALLAEREDFRALPRYFLEQYLDNASASDVGGRVRVAECVALAQIAVQRFRSKPLDYARDGEASSPAVLLREADACLADL
jgi:hypothetical protein